MRSGALEAQAQMSERERRVHRPVVFVTQPPVGAEPDREDTESIQTERDERQWFHGANGVAGSNVRAQQVWRSDAGRCRSRDTGRLTRMHGAGQILPPSGREW